MAAPTFSAAEEAVQYDYFIVRSGRDRSAELFTSVPVPIILERRVGTWWADRAEPRFARME